MLATSTLNTLPKLELAVILIYLMMLAKSCVPRSRLPQDHKLLFQQNDVSRFLGNIDGGIDRNPYIRILKRRRIIDAVAQIADRMSVALAMRGLRVISAQATSWQRWWCVRLLSQVQRPTKPPLRYPVSGFDDKPDFLANLSGDDFIVAGNDLDADAVFLRAAIASRAYLSADRERRHIRPEPNLFRPQPCRCDLPAASICRPQRAHVVRLRSDCA